MYNSAYQSSRFMLSPWTKARKRVLAIIAGILVAPHLKTTDDLFDTPDSPGTRSMVAAAIQWAQPIMLKIDEECGKS
jgi:hypothetical protein